MVNMMVMKRMMKITNTVKMTKVKISSTITVTTKLMEMETEMEMRMGEKDDHYANDEVGRAELHC